MPTRKGRKSNRGGNNRGRKSNRGNNRAGRAGGGQSRDEEGQFTNGNR